MNTKHTATPWHVDHGSYGEEIVTDNGTIIADIQFVEDLTDAQQAANAAYIVRACNAHDELVEALRAIAVRMECAAKAGNSYDYDDYMKVANKARAALARAEQETDNV